MGDGIGRVQSGVGQIDLGQPHEPVNKRGQTASQDIDQLIGILDFSGIGGRQTEKPKKVKLGTAEDAPRLDQAKGKSDIEKFFSSVGKGIKSLFTGLADKIAGLFKVDTARGDVLPNGAAFDEPAPDTARTRKESYTLNLGNSQPAVLSREAFVPLSFVPDEGEALPSSVSALNQLNTEIAAVAVMLEKAETPEARVLALGTMFRGEDAGVKANVAFVKSHMDFRAIGEELLVACTDEINAAAQCIDNYNYVTGENTTSINWADISPQPTAEHAERASLAQDVLLRSVFDLADKILENLLNANGWASGVSDDLNAFIAAKMDIIADADLQLQEKSQVARSMITNDFLLRGVLSQCMPLSLAMDPSAAAVVRGAFDVVLSLSNQKSVHNVSSGHEQARELFAALRDKHQGARMDDLFVALGMPAEYRKDA